MEIFNVEENLGLTSKYGFEGNEAKLYDMKDILKNKILNYRISKIKCQLKSNKGIYGIQFFYRNLNDGKESPIINVQSKEKDLIEQEFDLSQEYIIDMKTWLDQDTILIGFEIKTNKNRIFKFGYGNEEQLIKIPDLQNLDKIILGFGLNANEDGLVTSIYGYYINKNRYIFNQYKGILCLRKKLENPEYNEKIMKKAANMNKKNQILYRICKLPQNQFFNIMKYTQL